MLSSKKNLHPVENYNLETKLPPAGRPYKLQLDGTSRAPVVAPSVVWIQFMCLKMHSLGFMSGRRATSVTCCCSKSHDGQSEKKSVLITHMHTRTQCYS